MSNIVGDSEKGCQLSAAESTLVCSIFEDLQRQVDLIRFATLKSESEGLQLQKLPPITLEGDGGEGEAGASSLSLVDGDGSDSIVEEDLEAKLEYSNLAKEFAKLKLNSRRKSMKDKKVNYSEKSVHLSEFSRNVDYILKVIQETKSSLEETNNFGILKTEVERMSQELNKDTQLQSDIEAVKERISKLEQNIFELEEASFSEKQVKVGEINRLKDKHFLIESEGKETLKVAKLYFEAQNTVAQCKHRDDTIAQNQLISEVNAKIDRDVHCLATMEAWTHDFCEKLEGEIDTWKLKLRKDEMLMDMRIDAKRRDILAQEELMKSLNETIAQRLEELAPWEEEKAVERQERLNHMRRYYSARKLQRWWRGHMVKFKMYRKKKLKTKTGN